MKSREQRLGAAANLDIPPFQPRRPWITGDLQTVRNAVTSPKVDLSRWSRRRLWLAVSDGDALAAALFAEERGGRRPLVVLIHGLTGCEDSVYLRRSARFWLDLGHPVLCLNLRGNSPSRSYCRGHYHAGRSDDLRDALEDLAVQAPKLVESGLIAVGYSLGGNLLVKMLAEDGEALGVRAAATVSAPLDLMATSKRVHQARNRPYQRWLLRRIKSEAVAAPARVSSGERAAIEGARSVYEFDDTFIAPHFGFAGARDYYEQCSAQRFLGAVRLPLLAVQARDDPWISPEPYDRFPWAENPNLSLLLTSGGGHVGFHAADDPAPWHDRVIAVFVASVLDGGSGDAR